MRRGIRLSSVCLLCALAACDSGPFDIVFIDPPFGADLVGPCCEDLHRYGLLADDAFVYVETAARESSPATPPAWDLFREKRAGGVVSRLFTVG